MQDVDLYNAKRLIQVEEGIPIGGVLETDFYVSTNI